MKFLIIHHEYPEFSSWFYNKYPQLRAQSYQEQLDMRLKAYCTGFVGPYSYNLRKLGHEVVDVIFGNKYLQEQWIKENNFHIKGLKYSSFQGLRSLYWKLPFRSIFRLAKVFLFYPITHSCDVEKEWHYEVLSLQIKKIRPDVLLNHQPLIDSQFLRGIRPYIRLLVGQFSYLIKSRDLKLYDLILSPVPNLVDFSRKLGIRSEILRLGIEPDILKQLNGRGKEKIPISFIGNIAGPLYKKRRKLLEYLCKQFDEIKVWGMIGNLSSNSYISNHYMGEAWGLKMLEILKDSKITINCHRDDILYAGNIRLYEATGVGTMLITDWKENMPQLFECGKEVVTYKSPEECAKLIQYYLEHEEERKLIAKRGQERTFREHTSFQRMQELVNIIIKEFALHKKM